MKDFSHLTVKHRAWSGLMLWAWILATGLLGCAPVASENTIPFDIPEGLAVETLKEAARQAKVEFIFSSELVQGVRTPAIKGKYRPPDVFELMLAESTIVVVQHENSGVYSIQKSHD